MQFIAPISVDKAAQILTSYEQQVPILSDTVVEIANSNWQAEAKQGFSVKRRWKASKGWFQYTVLELKGTLAATADQKTLVNAHIQLGEPTFLVAAFTVLLLLFGTTSRQAGLVWLIVIVIVLMFALDGYVLYRVVNSLKTGSRH